MPTQADHLVIIVAAASDRAALTAVLPALRAGAGLAALVAAVTAADAPAVHAAVRAAPSPLAIAESVAGTAAADRIYLVPARQVVHVADGCLLRLAAARDERAHGVVDELLAELAAGLGDRVVAVLLAGALNATLAGAVALKEAGGLLLVQDEDPGAASLRPEVALLADRRLPAGGLAACLHDSIDRRALGGGEASGPAISAADLDRIVDLIGAHTGVDFSDYKRNTLLRRVQRRMSVTPLPDLAAYLELLERSVEEATILYREMLIGVTQFFRDPEAFALLAGRVIQPLLASPARSEPIRIWVAGCSTGEEAYSIAILVREALRARSRELAVKIFATDLDREAVEFASVGHYPAAIAADVSAERLERFFTRKGDGFQVAKAIREMVVFAPHNIARDPPFFRMDLVTCRNLLIYLQPPLQRRLFGCFHFALNPEGHLLLGTSEAVGDMGPFFTTVDAKWKLYRKKGDRPPRELLVPTGLSARAPANVGETAEAPAPANETLQDVIQKTLLHEFLPAFLIAGADFEIHYSSGNVGRYLTLPRGKPSFNLVKMATRELAVALSTGIRRALRERKPVIYDDFAVPGDGVAATSVRLVIKPFLRRADLGDLAVVVFEPPSTPVAADSQPFDLGAQSDQRIRDLEAELEQSKESLQAAIEELETANEELQATNEEVLAANEELQSTNEEVQSVNEELRTVNAEHQSKIAELTELNNDILNFLGSTNIGTVFLDQRLCVRKFTRAATAQINLIDKDIGRPLAHISNNIDYPHLVADAEEVMVTLVPKQRRVATRDGRWYAMRVLPYRTQDNVIKGVVITFIDISDIRVGNELLRTLSMVIENSTAMVVITDANGAIAYVNQRFCEVVGRAPAELLGQDLRRLHGDGNASAWPALIKAAGDGRRWSGRLRGRRSDGESYIEDATVISMADVGGGIGSLLKISSVIADGVEGS